MSSLRSLASPEIGLPDLPGLQVRALGERPDFDELARLVNRSYAADGIAKATTAADLQNFYDHQPNFDQMRDSVAAWYQNRMVAETYLLVSEQPDAGRVYEHHAVVDPKWRRPEILTPLVSWVERRIRQRAQAEGQGDQVLVRSPLAESEADLRELLASRGYEISRYFFIMVRPNLKGIPTAPQPEGLEVRPVRDEDLRAIWEAHQEAFRDHWGYREATEQDFQRFLHDPVQDPTLWRVAWDGDQVAGMILNYIDEEENEQLGRRRGYTEDIAVRRPWRRQGLATYLLAASLRVLREAGMEEAALAVDAENPSGALDLYRRMGYEVVRRSYAYEAAMADLPAGRDGGSSIHRAEP